MNKIKLFFIQRDTQTGPNPPLNPSRNKVTGKRNPSSRSHLFVSLVCCICGKNK